MTDHSIVGQLKAEILDLEKALNELDQRKKQLNIEIRTRKRALKLLNGSRSPYGDRDSSLLP